MTKPYYVQILWSNETELSDSMGSGEAALLKHTPVTLRALS